MNTTEWIEEQQTLIREGIPVHMLRLAGADETAFGTWPIKSERLAERIDSLIGSLRDELPKGKHQLFLMALDDKGVVLAQRPIAVTGQSAAATQAVNDTLAQSRAMNSNLQMAQQQIEAAHARSDAADKRAIDYAGAAFDMAESFMILKQKVILEEREEKREQLAHERKMELYGQVGPALAPIGEVIAELIKKKTGL